MTRRKADTESFPTRGTPTGYRDRWDVDDRVVIQAQNAERERQIVAVREAGAARRRVKDLAPGEPAGAPSPADRIAPAPE